MYLVHLNLKLFFAAVHSPRRVDSTQLRALSGCMASSSPTPQPLEILTQNEASRPIGRGTLLRPRDFSTGVIPTPKAVVLLKKVWVYPARVLKQATKTRRTESESIGADIEIVGQTFYEV